MRASDFTKEYYTLILNGKPKVTKKDFEALARLAREYKKQFPDDKVEVKSSQELGEGEVIPANFVGKHLTKIIPTKADLLYDLVKKKLSNLSKSKVPDKNKLMMEVSYIISELLHDNPKLEPNLNDLGLLSLGKKTMYDIAKVYIDRMRNDGTLEILGYELNELEETSSTGMGGGSAGIGGGGMPGGTYEEEYGPFKTKGKFKRTTAMTTE